MSTLKHNKKIVSLFMALLMVVISCSSPISVYAKQVERTKIVSAIPNENSVKLKWKKKKTAKYYQIKYSVNPSFSSSKTVKVSKKKKSRIIKKLTPGEKYYFKIRYKTKGGFSKWSKKVVCCAKPSAVKVTDVETVSDSAILIKWEKVVKSSGYIIEYSKSAAFSDKDTVNIKSNSQTQYVIKGLNSASSYFIKIRSYVTYGKKIAYSPYSVTYSLRSLPEKPVVNSISVNYNNAFINIATLNNVSGYELNYSKDESFSDYKGVNIDNTSNAQFLLKELDTDCKYFIRVRSYVRRGNVLEYSDFTYDSFVNYSKSVEILGIEADYKSAIISYTPLKNCSGYELDYSVSSDFNEYKSVNITDSSSASYKLDELKSDKTFYVRLRAYNDENDLTVYSEYAYSSFKTDINKHSYIDIKPNVAYNGLQENPDNITQQEYTSEPDYYTFEKNGYTFRIPSKLYFNDAPDGDGYYRTQYSITIEKTDSDLAKSVDEVFIYPSTEKVKMTLDEKPYAKAEFNQSLYKLSANELNNKAVISGEIMSNQIEALGWSGEAVFNIAFKSNDIIYSIPENANYIYVSPDGDDVNGDGSKDKPYKSIYYANSVITDSSKDKPYVIKVLDGVYEDLNELYWGTVSNSQYRGYICKDYVYYIGNVEHPENVIINYDAFAGVEDTSLYTNANSSTCDVFHIFSGRHTSIQGFTVNCQNVNYAVHIETTGTSLTSYSLANCIIHYNGHPGISSGGYYNAAIGCGSTYGEKGYFKDCVIINDDKVLKNNTICYTVHSNSTNPSVNCGADIMFENCEFCSMNSANVEYATVTFGTSSYSASYKTNNVYLINCKGTNSDSETRIKGTYKNDNYSCLCFKTDYINQSEVHYNEFEKAKFEMGSFGYSGYSNSTKRMRSCLIPIKTSTSYSIKVDEQYKIAFVVSIADETLGNIMKVGTPSNSTATISTGVGTSLLIVLERVDGGVISESELTNTGLEITES